MKFFFERKKLYFYFFSFTFTFTSFPLSKAPFYWVKWTELKHKYISNSQEKKLYLNALKIFQIKLQVHLLYTIHVERLNILKAQVAVSATVAVGEVELNGNFIS